MDPSPPDDGPARHAVQPSTPASRLIGFLVLAGALYVLVSGFAPGPWGLFAVVPLGLAVVAAGVEGLAPRRWLGRVKWALTATAAVVFAVGTAVDVAQAPEDSARPLTERTPGRLLGPDAYDETVSP